MLTKTAATAPSTPTAANPDVPLNLALASFLWVVVPVLFTLVGVGKSVERGIEEVRMPEGISVDDESIPMPLGAAETVAFGAAVEVEAGRLTVTDLGVPGAERVRFAKTFPCALHPSAN